MSHTDSDKPFEEPHQAPSGDSRGSVSKGRNGLRRAAARGQFASGDEARYGDPTLNDVIERIHASVAIIKNRWIAGVLAATAVVVGLGYMYSRSDEEHAAVTTMLAQSPLDEILRANSTLKSNQKSAQENFLQNHLSVMQSRRFNVALAQEFTEEEMMRIASPYMVPGRKPSMDSFERMLARRTSASRQRDREFFTLSFRHRDPDVAIMVADRMTEAYLKIVQNEIKETNLAAAEALRLQAEQLQSEISQLEEKQRQFREQHNIVSFEENQGLLAERLRRIDQSRSESRIRLFELEAQLKDAKADLEREEMPFHNPFLANFAKNQEMRLELDRLTSQQKVLALRYGRKHPKMIDIHGEIESVSETLRQSFQLAYKDLTNQYQAAVKVEQQLESEFRDEFGEGIEVGRLANQFLVIGSEVDAKREALKDLLKRVNEAVVTSKLPADVMRVVDPAYIARPKLAKKKLTAMFALLLGGGAFFGVPLGLHLFDQRLKCATDVEKELGKILLGGIPGLSKIPTLDRPHVVRDGWDPARVEPFMAIVAQLELMSEQEERKSFVLVSTAAGEGKSTMIANLAAGFAQIGRETLIVDGDLRRPCQHQFNRVKKTGGLLRWAEAGYPMENVFGDDSPLCIQKIASGASLLPAGGICGQPAEFLVSREVEGLFEKLKERFDVIIVDSPPAGIYPDAFILAQYVGETLLVARESTAPVNRIKRVISDMDSAAAPVLGVILNDYTSSSSNPRLVYENSYDKYNYYFKKKRTKEHPRAAAKSIVGKLMIDEESNPLVSAKKAGKNFGALAGLRARRKGPPAGPAIARPQATERRKKAAGGKSLISKLMSDQNLKD